MVFDCGWHFFVSIAIIFGYAFEAQSLRKTKIAQVGQTIAKSRRDAIQVADNIALLKSRVQIIEDSSVEQTALSKLYDAARNVDIIMDQLNDISRVLSDFRSNFDPMTIIKSCDAARINIARCRERFHHIDFTKMILT